MLLPHWVNATNVFQINDSLMSSHFIGKQPIPVWTGVVLILFRPWPTEVGSGAELLAGVEVWILALIGGWGWYQLRGKLRHALHPSILIMLFGLLFFGFFFSYMYNMGLMVRQRLMAFPTILYIYAWPYVCKQKYRQLTTQKRLHRKSQNLNLPHTNRAQSPWSGGQLSS